MHQIKVRRLFFRIKGDYYFPSVNLECESSYWKVLFPEYIKNLKWIKCLSEFKKHLDKLGGKNIKGH